MAGMLRRASIVGDEGKSDLKLGVDSLGLKGMTAAGSATQRDPTMVAFQQVIDRLNDLFGNDDFTEGQKISFLESLGRSLLENEALVQQARVNTPKQFAESPDFNDAVTGAVADNQGCPQQDG